MAFSCSTVPEGQANPSAQPEPLQPIWCAGQLASEPTTRQVDQKGGWLDDFKTNVQMGRFNSGDLGYRVFDSITDGGTNTSQHFVNNNHWMVDVTKQTSGQGEAISPNQSFRFENGQLVIETDVASGIPNYSDSNGDKIWPEVDWSTASAPTGNTVDGLYLYGHFGGAWAGGCRLPASRTNICAVETDHPLASTTNDQFPCFSQPSTRVMELSWFEACGSTHTGGLATQNTPWRACQDNQMDVYCRDRFRFVWTKSSLTVYVNGQEFFKDANWPTNSQIPDNIVNGTTPIYTYFGEWGDFTDPDVYRFHWGRVAVNPHDAQGNILPLSPAPSYCPGQQQDTCPAGTTSPPLPAVDPTPTPTPTSSSAPTPVPTTTPLTGFRSASTSTDSNTVSRPAGVQAGDLLLAALEVDSDPVKVTPPAGWKPLLDTPAAAGTDSAFHAMMFWKLAGSGEPGSYRFSAPSGVWTDVQVLDYAGVNATAPIDVAAGRDSGTTATPSSPALTTTAPGDRLVTVFIGFNFGTWTAPKTMTRRTDFDSNIAADKLLGLPGVATTKVATTNSGGATAALAVAIRYK